MGMYLYYDKNYVLREVVNTGLTTRQGNVNSNSIFIYVENAPSIESGTAIYDNKNGLSNEFVFNTASPINTTIPYDKFRDTKYFKDYQTYPFYKVDVPNEILQVSGLCKATFRLITSEKIITLGMFIFTIEDSVINENQYISQSQYDYLLQVISSYEELYDLAVIHTTNEIINGASASYEENRLVISTYNNSFNVFLVVKDSSENLVYSLVYKGEDLSSLQNRLEKLEDLEIAFDGSIDEFITAFENKEILIGNYISLSSNNNFFVQQKDNNGVFERVEYLTIGEHTLYVGGSNVVSTEIKFNITQNGYYKLIYNFNEEESFTYSYIGLTPYLDIKKSLTRSSELSSQENANYLLKINSLSYKMYNLSDNSGVARYGVYLKVNDTYNVYKVDTQTSIPPTQITASKNGYYDITLVFSENNITATLSNFNLIFVDKELTPFRASININSGTIIATDSLFTNHNIIVLTYSEESDKVVVNYPLEDLANGLISLEELENQVSEVVSDISDLDTIRENVNQLVSDNENLPNYIASLSTNSSETQTPNASERIYSKAGGGTQRIIKLHKISKTGSYNDLLDKPTIPTSTSDLVNDSNFITKEVSDLTNYYTKSVVDSKLSNLTNFHFEKVDELPQTGESNVIYLVPSSNQTTGNEYDEYYWDATSNTFETLGSTAIDLSNYYTKSETLSTEQIAETYYNKTESDSNYYTKSVVDSKLSNLTNFHFEKVDELPQTGESNVIYLVPSSNQTTGNEYDEYYWDATSNTFETLGSTAIDLSNYYTKSETLSTEQIAETYYNKTESDSNINTAIEDLSIVGEQGNDNGRPRFFIRLNKGSETISSISLQEFTLNGVNLLQTERLLTDFQFSTSANFIVNTTTNEIIKQPPFIDLIPQYNKDDKNYKTVIFLIDKADNSVYYLSKLDNFEGTYNYTVSFDKVLPETKQIKRITIEQDISATDRFTLTTQTIDLTSEVVSVSLDLSGNSGSISQENYNLLKDNDNAILINSPSNLVATALRQIFTKNGKTLSTPAIQTGVEFSFIAIDNITNNFIKVNFSPDLTWSKTTFNLANAITQIGTLMQNVNNLSSSITELDESVSSIEGEVNTLKANQPYEINKSVNFTSDPPNYRAITFTSEEISKIIANPYNLILNITYSGEYTGTAKFTFAGESQSSTTLTEYTYKGSYPENPSYSSYIYLYKENNSITGKIYRVPMATSTALSNVESKVATDLQLYSNKIYLQRNGTRIGNGVSVPSSTPDFYIGCDVISVDANGAGIVYLNSNNRYAEIEVVGVCKGNYQVQGDTFLQVSLDSNFHTTLTITVKLRPDITIPFSSFSIKASAGYDIGDGGTDGQYLEVIAVGNDGSSSLCQNASPYTALTQIYKKLSNNNVNEQQKLYFRLVGENSLTTEEVQLLFKHTTIG